MFVAKYYSIILTLSLLFVSTNLLAININPVIPVVKDQKANPLPKLEFLANFEGSNQVKLLNNRFRVDYEVDELLMLFFRKHGSKPIVLVRPDGSKLYTRDADNPSLEWYANVNYDLIKLKKPMAGPWQALGQIEKDSKIIVLTDVELLVDALPPRVFQYELIKGEARILNAKSIIEEGGFRNVVKLRSALYSTNDAEQENFGADLQRLGEFYDDGKGLDEKPNDGVFTLSYYFDVINGNWLPKYTLDAELFGREVAYGPIEVLTSPISYELTLAEPEERYHYVTFVIDETHLKAESLAIQGNIEYPNGEMQEFTLSYGEPYKLEIFQSEFGTFSIHLELFGHDQTGRDFRLKPPVYQFTTIAPTVESDDIIEDDVVDDDNLVSEKFVEPEPELSIGLVVTINLIILIVGFLIIWLVVLNKTIPNPIKLLKRSKKTKEAAVTEKPKAEKVDKNALDSDSSDDILDLSLPED